MTISNGGRITAANGDKASFGGNAIVSSTSEVNGQQEYQDHGPVEPMNLHGNVLAVVCSEDKDADIFGQATVDGMGTFNYRIRVHDGSEKKPSMDSYGIVVSNGYSSGDRPLEKGNVQIQIHEG